MHVDKTIVAGTGVGSTSGSNSSSSSALLTSLRTDDTPNQSGIDTDHNMPTVSEVTENAGRARCNCAGSIENDPQFEKDRLNKFTIPVLEFDNAGLRKFAHPDKGSLYVICTYGKDSGENISTDLNRIDDGIKNLDIFEISPDLKERIRTEGGGRIEPLSMFDPGRLTLLEALNLPEIEPFIDIQYIVKRVDEASSGTTAHIIQEPQPETENPPLIKIAAYVPPEQPAKTPAKVKTTETKAPSIIGKEIVTFDDYTAIVYGLFIALNKIEKAGEKLIETIETSLEDHTNRNFVKLIHTTNASEEVTITTLKLADKAKLNGGIQKFHATAIIDRVEKELNELAKAVNFYCELTPKLGGRTEESNNEKERLFYSFYEGVHYKLSTGICSLLGDREVAAGTHIKDFIPLQQREQKIMPYPTNLKPSLTRLMHYEGLFLRELDYLVNGLDVERISREMSRYSDDQYGELKKILVDFIPRFKRYFCEKITPPPDTDPTKYLKTCITKLYIRMLHDFDSCDFDTIRDTATKEGLLKEKQEITALYKAIEEEYRLYNCRKYTLQRF